MHHSWAQEAKSSTVRAVHPIVFLNHLQVAAYRKREHLLAQIREQAEQITRLMAQLEEANKKALEAQSNPPFDAPSPSQSATTESFSMISRITSPEIEHDAALPPSPDVHKTNAEVQDWIAKARASIEAFGGYISMGGPSATREMLAGDEDDEDSAEEPTSAGVGGTEVEVAVQDADGEDVEAGSADEGSVTTSRNCLATIPNAEAPFGLLAQMSLRKDKGVRRIKSKSDLGDEEEEDVGLANDDYFRPSKTITLLSVPQYFNTDGDGRLCC